MSYDYLIVSLDADHEVYADVDTADLYLNASTHGQAWFALSDDQKGQALVTATRTLDRQQWKGLKAATSPLQALDWPRIETGVLGVEDDEIPADIVNASIELALSLATGSAVQDEANTSQKISSLRAGSVAISYFRGAEGIARRFPTIVDELVRPYLASTSLGLAGVAYGTTGTSQSEEDFGVNQGM